MLCRTPATDTFRPLSRAKASAPRTSSISRTATTPYTGVRLRQLASFSVPPRCTQTSEAVTLFRVAREGFREIGLPWEEALLGIDMATLLDAGEPEVVAAAARSREILTGLSARPFLDRLDAALGEVPTRPSAPATHAMEAADRTLV